MSDPNDPHYDWLYSGRPKRRPGDAGPDRPADRPADRPVERPVERPSASQDPEPTRVLAAQPRTTPGSQPPPAGPPPGGRVAASPPRPRRSRRRWVRRALLALVLAWLVFMVAVPIWAWSKVEKVDAEPAGNRPDDTP